LGLKLRTPLVASASPLSQEIGGICLLQDAGASAVVLYSLFEEQLRQESFELEHHLADHVLERPHAGTVDLESNAEFLLHRLQGLVPRHAELWCHPEYFVQFGFPAKRILQFAAVHRADLIVMGVRPLHGAVSTVTHLAHTTAQHIVAHATCPVLTIRG
jgi:nucleotide-binding universal stress UspA family protein